MTSSSDHTPPTIEPAIPQPTTTPSITLRAPSSLPSATSSTVVPPTLQWLSGTWNVTHSTLPMWKKNKNVQITYKAIPGTSPAHIDDLVTYQALGSSKLKTVHGVDKPFSVLEGSGAKEGGTHSGADAEAENASLGYNWRGKGWLAIASSKWEIVGWGSEGVVEGEGDKQWAVTYFAKTLFTPAGVDIYSRKGQLKEETITGIKEALKGLGGDVEKLAAEIFAVASDGDRSD